MLNKERTMHANDNAEMGAPDDGSWALEILAADVFHEDPERARLLTLLHGTYITSARDKRLSNQFDRLVDGALLPHQTDPGKRLEGRGLFVLGESHAGKSRSILHLFSKRTYLKPYESDIGTMMPLVSVVAPSPCTLRQLANAILDKIGYDTKSDLKENVAWRIVKQQLENRKTIILHIDEIQHCLQSQSDLEKQKLLDTLKNLMQNSEWPVRLVLSGLPEFGLFARQDKQIPFRSRTIHLPPLSVPGDIKWVRFMVKEIFGRLNVDISGISGDDFYLRLCHAASNFPGRIARYIQGAGEEVIYDNRGEVTTEDFAEAYSLISGCEREENVFLARNWHLIYPDASLNDTDDDDADEPKRGKGKRGRK